jgi:hypothetical protein
MPYPDNYNSRTAPDGFDAGRRADAAESAANEYYEDHKESIQRAVAILRGFFDSLSSTAGHMGKVERSTFAQRIQEAIIEGLDLDTNSPDGFNDAYSVANDQAHDMRRASFGPSFRDIERSQILSSLKGVDLSGSYLAGADLSMVDRDIFTQNTISAMLGLKVQS